MLITHFDTFAIAGSVGRGPAVWDIGRFIDDTLYRSLGYASRGAIYTCTASSIESFGTLSATGADACNASITLPSLPVLGYAGIEFPLAGSLHVLVGGVPLNSLAPVGVADHGDIFRVPFADMNLSEPTFAVIANSGAYLSAIDWVAVYREEVAEPATVALMLVGLALLAVIKKRGIRRG